MERVTIYLRTSLFSISGDNAHLPKGVLTLEGTVVDRPPGGVVIDVAKYLDERGRELECDPQKLFLPWAKVDHVVLQDA
jgi:hypothetical protein